MENATVTGCACPDDPRRAKRVCVALLLIFLVGFFLRVYRLSDQSIWADEWPNVVYLKASGPLTYVRLIQIMYPEQAQGPAYYFLQYYWAHWMGSSVTILRLLPVLIGMSAIPLLYMLGRLLGARTAGLIAALCVTLSPQHIWHAQEIRPYAMLTPLVAVALYALVRALRGGGRRWWALNLAAGTILPWVHVFSVLFIGTESLFLLFFARNAWKRTLAWGGCQFLLLLPWALWMSSLPYSNEHPAAFRSLRNMAEDILADDIVSIHTDLLPPWKTSPVEALAPPFQTVLRARPAFDTALLAVFCVAAAWLTWQIVKSGWLYLRASASREPLERAVLLFLTLAVPGLVLGALTMATRRPFLSPMYTMYNTVGLYVALGLMIARLRYGPGRALVVASLVLLYGYQLLITLPLVTRTDYRAGAAYIEAHRSGKDLALDFEYFWPTDCLQFYLSDSGIPVRRVTSLDAACEQAAGFIGGAPQGEPRAVWLTFELGFIEWLYPQYPLESELDESLAERGLVCSRHTILGHRNLEILRISAGDGGSVREAPEPVPDFTQTDFEEIIHDLHLPPMTVPQHDAAVAALRTVIPRWPPLNKFFFLMHGVDLLEQGHPDLAQAVALALLDKAPRFGLAHFLLGMSLVAKDDCPAALTGFQNAFKEHAGLRGLVGTYVDAICATPNAERAYAEMGRLEATSFVFAPAMKAVSQARFGSPETR